MLALHRRDRRERRERRKRRGQTTDTSSGIPRWYRLHGPDLSRTPSGSRFRKAATG